jgi:hypothetical protein
MLPVARMPGVCVMLRFRWPGDMLDEVAAHAGQLRAFREPARPDAHEDVA